MRAYYGEPPASGPFLRQVDNHTRWFDETSDIPVSIAQQVKDRQIVMLGEATHGTSEFYSLRAAITKHLIRDHGFRFVAVEGDWPACFAANRAVKGGQESIDESLQHFNRWPTWMWANHEVRSFLNWLREWNASSEENAGFYGLDVYSLTESMTEVLRLLQQRDPAGYQQAKKLLDCFHFYGGTREEYARAVALVARSCEKEAVDLLVHLRKQFATAPRVAGTVFDEERLYLDQNAVVIKHAEEYYRKMLHTGGASWNTRDKHMHDTLKRLLAYHGEGTKAVVWAHNTHIGDATFTDMAEAGMTNIGALAREQFGQASTALVGFGTYRGSVVAGRSWGAAMQTMTVPPARENSWEEVFHTAGDGRDGVFLSPRHFGADHPLLTPRGNRAIGVVYNPANEFYGNYVPTSLPRRYDLFVFIDETKAVTPIPVREFDDREFPDTFPAAV